MACTAPTTSYTLAARLATLEGAEHCLLVPSGLAAVTLTSLALLRRVTRCWCRTTSTARTVI
jgi:cystathionine beta-lyase/cystathionine gamma-synthase